MTPVVEHRLEGLEPDNLLAFLALLGLLRSLEVTKPYWRPRVRWDVSTPPTRPVLVLNELTTSTEVAESAAAGCDVLAEDYEFGKWKVPNMPSQEARALLLSAVAMGPAGRSGADVLAAILSDLAKKTDEAVTPTALCLLFGQGHQYFLERLSSVSKQRSAPPRGKGRKAVTPTPAETLQSALFQTWERIDPSQGFRWDPAEDRRYALRFTNPSDEEALTVHGANRLAAIGLPILTAAPTTARDRVKLQPIGVRHANGDTQVTWPIWLRSTSLGGIRALLTHPLLYEKEDRLDRERLRMFGVHEIRRATRISAGKFLNFTRAVAV